MNYLARRTCETIGKRIDRAEAIVVGEVIETGGQSVAVHPEDAVALRSWFSGEASASPSIMLYRTVIRVEQWLKGPGETNTIEIAYVPRWQSVGSEQLPLFNLHAQGLAYLCRIPSSLPYGAYLPAQSYQLAPGETALRSYSGTNKATQQSEESEASVAEEEVDALRWYVGLPTGNEDRSKSMFAALDNTNPRIVRQALRELAERHAAGSAERFTEMLKSASDELRVRLMLGLWILGETDVAVKFTVLEDLCTTRHERRNC